jgi:xylulokinase
LILDRKFSVNHLLWLREHHRELFAQVRHWLCVPDFIAWKLSGQRAMDRCIASRTMLLDQHTLQWSPEMLELSGLDPWLLPAVVPCGTPLGHLTADAAELTGLPTSTIVVSGGHDHLVGAFAAGLVQPGGVLESTGTAAVVLQLSDSFRPTRALFEAGLETYAFVTPRSYAVLGAIDLAGGAVDWLIRTLWGEHPRATVTAFNEAAAVPRGAAGCVWLPHLLGSGTPWNDSASRAAVLGIRLEHTRAHMLRGLLEGLAYWLRENLEVAAASSKEIVAIGGATRTPFWTQLKADVCGRIFRVPHLEESVALGAALLAGIGVGVFATPQAAVASQRMESRTFVPDDAATRLYEAWYSRVYRELYPALHDVNAALGEVVSS